MHPEEIVKKANDAINKWAVGSKKLVVAIDGYTGVGKTTLLNQLAEINQEILPVYKDDFLLGKQERERSISPNLKINLFILSFTVMIIKR